MWNVENIIKTEYVLDNYLQHKNKENRFKIKHYILIR